MTALFGPNNPKWKGGLITRKCDTCGMAFTIKPSAIKNRNGRFCSKACYGKYFSLKYKGKDNYFYSGVGVICVNCGKAFNIKRCHQGVIKCCSKKCSLEYRSKNKIRPILKVCQICGGHFSIKPSQNKLLGHGKFCSYECAHKNHSIIYKGGNSHFWKGGVTPKHTLIRQSGEYSDWRKNVFKRDSFACQVCGKIGGKLNAHHIKHFHNNPVLRMDIANGITLCKSCHKKEHSKGE